MLYTLNYIVMYVKYFLIKLTGKKIKKEEANLRSCKSGALSSHSSESSKKPFWKDESKAKQEEEHREQNKKNPEVT